MRQFTKTLLMIAVLNLTAHAGLTAEIEKKPLLRLDMTMAEMKSMKTSLEKTEKKACSPDGIGKKISNAGKYAASAISDTLPGVPLAWTGIQNWRGKAERVEEKKIAAGGSTQLYATEAAGGAVIAIVTVASLIFEAMVEEAQTHDQVHTSGYMYNSQTGRTEYMSGYVSVPNGKTYQPTGAVTGALGWLASAYSNTRTLGQAIEREKQVKAEVCRQAQANLLEVTRRIGGTTAYSNTPTQGYGAKQ